MSQADFEPCYAKLFEVMSSAPGVRKASRRLVHWTEVAVADHPALFTAQGGERQANLKGQPGKWRLVVDLYLYVHVGSSAKAVPAQQLNSLLREIRLRLVPNAVSGVPAGFEGLCSHVWIEGEIEIFDGVLGSQAVAVVPVEMLTV